MAARTATVPRRVGVQAMTVGCARFDHPSHYEMFSNDSVWARFEHGPGRTRTYQAPPRATQLAASRRQSRISAGDVSRAVHNSRVSGPNWTERIVELPWAPPARARSAVRVRPPGS